MYTLQHGFLARYLWIWMRKIITFFSHNLLEIEHFLYACEQQTYKSCHQWQRWDCSIQTPGISGISRYFQLITTLKSWPFDVSSFCCLIAILISWLPIGYDLSVVMLFVVLCNSVCEFKCCPEQLQPDLSQIARWGQHRKKIKSFCGSVSSV